MFIDTHTHLNFDAFDKDWRQVINRAQKSGINKMIVVGTDIDSSKKAVALARQAEGVHAAVGFHPHHAKSLPEIDNVSNQLEKLAKNDKVVAIGECGLDYYVYQNTKYGPVSITEELKNSQKQLFGLQIQLAKKLQLPLIIHNRQAEDDILDTIDHFCKIDGQVPTGVFHCISGSLKFLTKVLKLGFYVGIDGNVTYDNQVQALAQAIPLNKLLIETDSPFLAPEPLRSKQKRLRNEPFNVKIVAQFLSELKNTPIAAIEKVSTKNAQELFSI